jgi:uncharacterized protein (TIGR03437 family)
MPLAFAMVWRAAAGLCLCVILNAASDRPELLASDVINAADHSGGKVAPGEIVVLFPSNAGPAVLAGTYAAANGKVTTRLGQTRVLFDGIEAPMAYSMKGQVGAVVPYEIADRKTTDVVVEYEGVRSAPVTLPVVKSAPAVFTLDLSGKGQAAMLNDTGCCNSARNPATRGAIATLYATGEGQTRPLGISGIVSKYPRISDYPVPQLPVKVMVGGESAEIVYAGEAPNAVAGLFQVNFRVPRGALVGDAVPLVLKIGNSRSADGITMAIRSAVQQVLVVDEEPSLRKRLGRMLAGAGYAVCTAGDGGEAMRQAEAHPLDLVIWSLAMPEEERLDAIRAIQAQRPRLKIIALAGTRGPATLRAADLLGAQTVLTKTMPVGSVLRRVREALRVRPVEYSAREEVQQMPLNGPIQR